MSLELIKRTTLTQMVVAWNQSADDIRQAFNLIVGAEARLKAAFSTDGYEFNLERHGRSGLDYEKPEELFKEWKKDAWRILIQKMQIRSLMSVKRAQELDKQLETGEGLPDIEETQILAMMEGTMLTVEGFMDEAVKEVFEFLRPQSVRALEYKTNEKFTHDIGRKVILGWAVERAYSSRKFRVNYNRQKEITALDNVFHLLDGRGPIKSYHGPLYDAIQMSEDGRGETDFFAFKCFGNGNLHLEIKRTDLLDKLNAIGGGANLKDQRKAAA